MDKNKSYKKNNSGTYCTHQYYNCKQMIKTLSDYNLLENEEWKDSINTLFLELRSKLPEFFKGLRYTSQRETSIPEPP